MDAPDLLVWDAGNREHLAERNARRVAAGQAPVSEQECDDLFLSGDWVWEEVEHRTRDGPHRASPGQASRRSRPRRSCRRRTRCADCT